MEKYYLAINLGVTYGRHILGHYNEGKMELEEVYRFENRMLEQDGYICWNLDNLYQEILTGLRKCKEQGKIPISMGIDSCGGDFVLLDQDNNILRDGAFYEMLSKEAVEKIDFTRVESFLMVPNYIGFLLTGEKKNEYTLATATNLLDTKKKDWDYARIESLGLPKKIFEPIGMPGEYVGQFLPSVEESVGFACKVVQTTCYAMASATMGDIDHEEDALYIGTDNWSLVHKSKDVYSERRSEANQEKKQNLDLQFMNKSSLLNPKRHIKNLMGMWVMQNVKSELADQYSFEKLANFAEDYFEYEGRIDLMDERFLSQRNVITQIQYYLKEHNSSVCQSIGELVACVYLSLAENYGKSIQEIEEITGKTYDVVHILNGSYNTELLNELTAEYTGKKVCAIPEQATALGNLSVQMLALGEFASIEEARKSIQETYELQNQAVKSN